MPYYIVALHFVPQGRPPLLRLLHRNPRVLVVMALLKFAPLRDIFQAECLRATRKAGVIEDDKFYQVLVAVAVQGASLDFSVWTQHCGRGRVALHHGWVWLRNFGIVRACKAKVKVKVGPVGRAIAVGPPFTVFGTKRSHTVQPLDTGMREKLAKLRAVEPVLLLFLRSPWGPRLPSVGAF